MVKEYNKLVRDKIPEIIKKDGKVPVVHTASEEEYLEKLKEKLKEEVEEFLKDGKDEEIADLLEVIEAIVKAKNLEMEKIEKIKSRKAEERGGFSKRLVLERVE